MATNKLLKFYRGSQPTNPQAGAIWFDPTSRAISVYNGTEWEAYSGILNAAIVENVLVLTKADGTEVRFDFSDVASASAIAQQISGLDTRIGTLETTVNDAENGLVKKVADLRTEVNALGGAEGGIQGMIDASIEALDLPNTYEVKGDAAKAEAAAKAYADGLVKDKDGNSLFDAKGSAEAAESNAKLYTDALADGAVKNNADAIAEIKGDYLKASDKTELSNKISENEKAIAGNTAAINTILGNDDDVNYNSIAELAAWITTHGVQAEGFATAIGENKAAIEKEVEDRGAAIEDAIEVEIERANEAYATAAQGAKADTAIQSVEEGETNGTIKVDGTAVAVHGLGSAAYTNVDAYDAAGAAAEVLGTAEDTVEANTVYGAKAAAVAAETNAKSYADSLWVWEEF